MISIQKSGDTINFTFTDSSHYLYGNGTISVPENSLTLTIDESDIVNFKKADSNDIFISATLGEFGKTKAELIQFYKENMVNAGISSGDVETRLSEKVDTSAFTSYSGSIESRLSEDEEVTSAALNALNETVEGKVDASAITSAVTSGSTDAEIPTAKAVYDAIPQGGGGKAVSGGTNISITTGETADTINCTIPYSDTIHTNSDIILGKDLPKASDYNRVFYGKKIASRGNSLFSNSIGIGVPPSKNSSDYNELYGSYSIGIGGFKIGNGSQNSNTVGGCVAIGYGAKTRISDAVAIGHNTEASGTTKTNINNQLKIDTSNQVYISNSANTSTYCLQEKIENTEAALGGLKLVQMSQSEYDALVNKDANTIYYIVN